MATGSKPSSPSPAAAGPKRAGERAATGVAVKAARRRAGDASRKEVAAAASPPPSTIRRVTRVERTSARVGLADGLMTASSAWVMARNLRRARAGDFTAA
jgi:hypothetical protein